MKTVILNIPILYEVVNKDNPIDIRYVSSGCFASRRTLEGTDHIIFVRKDVPISPTNKDYVITYSVKSDFSKGEYHRKFKYTGKVYTIEEILNLVNILPEFELIIANHEKRKT